MTEQILKGWVVVVVEDEPDSLDLAEILLMQCGATVHTARNGVQGMEIIRKVRPNMVISDLAMPQMDGWAMMKALKKDRATMDIPVIALTAHAMLGDREKAMAAGFHNYLTKPLTLSTFFSEMVRIVSDIEMT